MPTLNIRLTQTQAERLLVESTELGITRGSLVKERVFGGVPLVRKPRPDEVQLRRLVGEIGKIGSNVNQISKRLNQGHGLDDRRSLGRIHTDLGLMRENLLKTLGVTDK